MDNLGRRVALFSRRIPDVAHQMQVQLRCVYSAGKDERDRDVSQLVLGRGHDDLTVLTERRSVLVELDRGKAFVTVLGASQAFEKGSGHTGDDIHDKDFLIEWMKDVTD